MLRSEKDLKGYRIQALDGEIGKVHDFFVGDESWLVRYLVVDTGVWIPKRKVLLSPLFLGRPGGEERCFPVRLSRQEIEDSPEIHTDMPVSMERKQAVRDYGWLALLPLTGQGGTPGAVPPPAGATPAPAPHYKEPEQLRSLNEGRGYRVRARDGKVGRVADFIVDDHEWIVRYAVIDIGGLLPEKSVLLSPGWAEWVHWAGQEIHVDLRKHEIESAPEYSPFDPVNRELEVRTYNYYGRPTYWSP
jgi:hypothetical protein